MPTKGPEETTKFLKLEFLKCENWHIMNTVQRAYRYRFYPTAKQDTILSETFGCARFVYNHFLRVRTDGFYQNGKRIGYNETAKLLTDLKQQSETNWLQDVSNVVLQQSLRNLDTAFKNFFQGRAKYPSFKTKHGQQSARYTTSGFRWKDGKVYLAKMDAPLNIRWSREFSGRPSSVTVRKDAAGRYFISILVEEEAKVLPVINKMVGVDLGLKDATILSNGEKIPNPTQLRKAERKLARAQKWPGFTSRSRTVARTGRTNSHPVW